MIDYPDFDKEVRIILARQPALGPALAQQVARFVASDPQGGPAEAARRRREPGLGRGPPGLGIAELGAEPERVHATLVCLLKTREDRSAVAPEMTARLLGKVA